MLFRAFLALSACTGALAQTAGVTTRYWDCCKPSCAWPGKAALSSTLKTCSASGSVLSDQNAVSGCDGGTSFMCTSDAPVVVSDTLAYGTAATALSGLGESDTCCSCYKLTFTSAPLVGKTLIVQSINTGGDLGGNQFDLAIPGGGMGIFTSGCPSQFGVSANNFGAQYGGVSSDAECDNLPSALQEGCRFRFGWMQGADNPSVTFAKVACPAALVARTGCLRSGETTDGSAVLTSSKVTTTSSKTAVTTSRKTTTTAKASTSSAKATSSNKPVTSTKATASTAKPATSKKPTTSSTRMTTSVKSSAAACSPHTTTTSASKGVAQLYYQCGGIGWTGATTCATGSTCKKQNPYYSQCL